MTEETVTTKALIAKPETSSTKKDASITLRNQTIYFDLPEPFIHSAEEEINAEVVMKFINLHKLEKPRYQKLMDMYKGKYDIFTQTEKEEYKPDNRVAVNFVKYLVDTLAGYFIGIPVKVNHQNKVINKIVQNFNKRNELDDVYYELAKKCLIQGRAYAIEYQNEKTETCVTYESADNMFIVYDDTAQAEPLFAVRYYQTDDGLKGELYTLDSHFNIVPSDNADGIALVDDPETAFYESSLSVVEFIPNEERMSVCESVISLINNYNKGFSEKGNDVDYFADAYLAILGAAVDGTSAQKMRDNRLINLFSSDGLLDASKIVVKFLEKPNADDTQEHYLDRLERLIFQIAMVVNISDDDFGSSTSGEALGYKVLNMSNLALTMERKFKSAMNSVYKMFFSVPLNFDETVNTQKLDGEIADEWFNLDYQFTRNMPKNVKDEAETAKSLAGVTSKKTQLSTLSVVKDVDQEIEQIKLENEPSEDPYPEGSLLNGQNESVLGTETGESLDESGEGSGQVQQENDQRV